MKDNHELIDFLTDLKDNINNGISRNDLKTLINQKIKSINDAQVETCGVGNNEDVEKYCKNHKHIYSVLNIDGDDICDTCGKLC